jgi:membrane carboxypeptidase/penicillin-binding protein PbpC
VDVFTHAWYVDDRFLKTVKAGENVLVAVPEGEHTISCVDDKGRVGKVKITIRYLG